MTSRASSETASPTGEVPQRPWPSLPPDTLLRQAMGKTDLSDFGDMGFLERLRAIIADLEEIQENLTFDGYVAHYQRLVGNLESRLRIEGFLARCPEALARPIDRPVFIMGPPRSGTTLLQGLLAQDPNSRPFYFWELRFPCMDKTEALRLSNERLKYLFDSIPNFRQIHHMDPEKPEECHTLLQYNLASSLYLGNYPRALRLLEETDPIPLLRDYRRQVLALAQWNPLPARRLLFKNVILTSWVGPLLSVFPGASFVVTHREPESFVPSACSLYHSISSLSVSEIDPRKIGEAVVRRLERKLRSHLEQRESIAAERIFDVKYSSLVRDPLDVVERIYAYFDLGLDGEARRRMTQWINGHPRNKYGKHRYSLAKFGLSKASLETPFKAYRERFSRYF